MRQELSAATTEDLPLPGHGSTAVPFEALFELARGDLELALARLAEAHHDARAIAVELGADCRTGLCTECGQPPVRTRSSPSNAMTATSYGASQPGAPVPGSSIAHS